MNKKIIIVLIIFNWIKLFGQIACEDIKIQNVDAVNWYNSIGFAPKYIDANRFRGILNSLSWRAYDQMSIEIRVTCRENKSKYIDMFYSFWDGKISKSELYNNYPAYYIFYQIDEMAGKHNGYKEIISPKPNYSTNNIDNYSNKYLTVKSKRAYFYSYPNYNNQKRAYLVYGETILPLEKRNGFIYIEFSNANNIITKGWISVNDLR